MKTFALLLLLVSFAQYALAAVPEPEAGESTVSEQPQAQPRQKTRWAVAGSPRYYSLYNGNNVTTFGSTGNLGSPKTKAFGIELLGYVIFRGDWQVGLGFGGTGYADDNAINAAEYYQSYFGAWLGKQIQFTENFDTELGSLFAVGYAQTELINTGASGRTTETSFMMEPKLTLAYRISPWFKLGVSGSYLIPAFESQKIRGQNLTGNAHISARGPSAGVEFIFGQ